jgi:hypothetical protein
MNVPLPPTILPDSNFTKCNTTVLESQDLILKTSIVPIINNIIPTDITTKQGVFVLSEVNLNLGEFITFQVISSFIREESIIFVSILSSDVSIGLITNTYDISNGGFSVKIQNVGVSILINEPVKISYMIIN